MLENREGQNVPDVTFRTRQDHQWVNVSSNDIFKGLRDFLKQDIHCIYFAKSGIKRRGNNIIALIRKLCLLCLHDYSMRVISKQNISN